MFYSDEIVNSVVERSDIVDVISGYVHLKRQGAGYMGLCPFHGEKTPSFSVSPSKQMFYCFGCHKGGDVITFVEEYENYNFQEALEALAKRAGMEIAGSQDSDGARREKSRRSRLMDINKDAASYYYYCLRDPAGESGMKYLRGRRIGDEIMKAFGLGFSPVSGGLVPYLKAKGYTDEELVESGLAVMSEKYGLSDRFWNRVMFPIMNVHNKVVGFGGRVMGDGKPKYLNSRETPVFEKSRNLYGLNRARSSRADSYILCEGYIDVISMHQAGFTQAVATLGTAFTEGHAALISRYTKKVILVYDSDTAGVDAALRAIPICRDRGIICRVADMSPHKDPDEFIKELGAEEFQKRLDQAENSLYFELRILSRRYNMSDPSEKAAFSHIAARHLAAIEDDMERDNYIQSVAAKYVMNPSILEREVMKTLAGSESISLSSELRDGVATGGARAEDGMARTRRYLLNIMAEEPGIFPQVEKWLSPEDFGEDIVGKVASLLFTQLREGRVNPAAISREFGSEDQGTVAGIFNGRMERPDTREEYGRFVTDLVCKIKKDSLLSASPPPGDFLEAERLRRNQEEELKSINIVMTEV